MVLRIRKPRGITKSQVLVVSIIGVIAGTYIWQPLFTKYREENKTKANSSAGQIKD